MLVAVMNLIDRYPNSNSIFVGFFMMKRKFQKVGIESLLISEALNYLKKQGFEICLLGIDKANPQSNYFWNKNVFEII
jgi:GNAT superfamily N-acetyltransferase